MAFNVISAIDLDMAHPNANIVDAVQYDSSGRVVKANLLNNGTPWQVPNGVRPVIRYIKSDRMGGFYDTDENGAYAIAFENNRTTVYLTLALQALTTVGTVDVQVNFYNTSGIRVTSFAFRVRVQRSVIPDSQIVSSDYYNALTAAVQEAAAIASLPESIARAEDAANKAETAASTAEQDVLSRVPTMVNDWLGNNITNPSNPPLDRTLSLSTAAAPADLTGKVANRISYPFYSGYYLTTVGQVVNLGSPAADASWSNSYAECLEGDTFIISAGAGANPSQYAFLDSSKKVIEKSEAIASIFYENNVVTAPKNASYIVVNNHPNYLANDKRLLIKEDRNDVYYNFKQGYYFLTPAGGSVNLTSPSAGSGWSCAMVPCDPGDCFTFSAGAVSNPSTYVFTNLSGQILERASIYTLYNYKVIAPANASYLIVNNHINYVPKEKTYIKRGTIDKPMIVDSSGNGDFTSFVEALYKSGADLIVRAGTYNVVNEYKALFGDTIFSSISDSYTIIGMFRYGPYISRRKVYFMPGSAVICDLNNVLNVDSTHRFSAINLGIDAEIYGLLCDTNKTFYVVHDDYGDDSYYTNIIKDCCLTGNVINANVIGGGCRNHSTNIVDGCYMNNREGTASECLRYHNYNSSSAQPKVIVRNCRAAGKMRARYYGDQSTPLARFFYYNNSTGGGIEKTAEGSASHDNISFFTWGNVIE